MTEVAALASFMVFIFVYSLFMSIKPKNESVEEKLKRLTSEKEASNDVKKTVSWKNHLTSLSRFTPQKWSKRLDMELHNSGITLNGGEFIILQTFLLVLTTLLSLVFFSKSIGAILLPLLSMILPRFYIVRSRNKRIQQFNNQLADVLLTLANSLKAGFSLFQAMEMSAQEMPDPISSEIRITLKEMAFGESTENALLNFSQRVRSRDLDLVVTAILIQRLIGGNLAEILINIHDTIQERLRIQGEIKSLTAQGRLSGYIIGALPFFLGLVITIMEPSYITPLFHNSIGIMMITLGLVFQIIGFLVIRKIVDIKY